MPAVSTMRNRRRCQVSVGVDRVARRARHLADEHALLVQQPVHQRRLADVRPADDRDAWSRLVGSGLGTGGCGLAASSSGSELAGSEPLSPARLEPRRRSRRAARRRPCRARRRSRAPARTRAGRTPSTTPARALVVGLVDGEQHRAARSRAARARSSRRRGPALRVRRPEAPADRRRRSRAAPAATTSSCSGSSLAPYSPPVSNSWKRVPRQTTGRASASRVVPAIGRDDRPAASRSSG